MNATKSNFLNNTQTSVLKNIISPTMKDPAMTSSRYDNYQEKEEAKLQVPTSKPTHTPHSRSNEQTNEEGTNEGLGLKRKTLFKEIEQSDAGSVMRRNSVGPSAGNPEDEKS